MEKNIKRQEGLDEKLSSEGQEGECEELRRRHEGQDDEEWRT
jgi:hypothetical protein